MLPDFLSKFQAQLESYRLDYLKITAQPLRRNQSLTLTQSKFLGTTFMPLGMPYPRDYSPGKPVDVMLLQIDTDKEIMFGDSGVANVFISPIALKNRQFDEAYFHWDCC